MALEKRRARYALGSKPRLSRRIHGWLDDKIAHIPVWLSLAAVALLGLWFTLLLVGFP